MKKFIPALIATALCTAAFTASASASVPIGNCTLHAYVPTLYNGTIEGGEGLIDSCPGFENLSLTVCTQELVTGGWQTIGSTCRSGSQNGVRYLGYYAGSTSAVNGRYYRTADSGYANGAYASYQSSGIKG